MILRSQVWFPKTFCDFLCLFAENISWNCWWKSTQTTNAQWSLFLFKSRTLGLGQSNCADEFWGIWGIFGQTISTHFGTVSPLFMFSITYSTIISTKKNKPLYPHSRYLFIWDWNLNLVRKELGILPLCVRSPCSTSMYFKVRSICSAQTTHKPVQQGTQQALRAYYSNIYTVQKGFTVPFEERKI